MGWRTVLCRQWPRLTALVGILSGWAASALAQEGAAAGPPPDAEPPGYSLPYGVVMMGIVLGLLFVLNTSRRRDRAKPEVYGEAK